MEELKMLELDLGGNQELQAALVSSQLQIITQLRQWLFLELHQNSFCLRT